MKDGMFFQTKLQMISESLCFPQKVFHCTMKPESLPSPWYTPHSDGGWREWGKREMRLTIRWRGKCEAYSDERKIMGSPVLSRAVGQHILPSLPLHTLIPTDTPGQTKTWIYLPQYQSVCPTLGDPGLAGGLD